MSRSALSELVRARIRVFFREPATLFWVFAFPLILAVVLGLAQRDRPPEPARVGVPDQAASALVATLAGDPMLAVTRGSPEALEASLGKATLDAVVSLPTGADAAATPVVRHDPTRPEGRLAKLLIENRLLTARLGAAAGPTIREAHVTRKGARYIDFLMPALIAMGLMSSSLWGVGYGMVQERSKGLMRRFATTPLGPASFLASYILSRFAFLALEVIFLLVAGDLLFDVTVTGSLLAYAVVCVGGVACFTGLAVLCASRTASVEVVSGFVNALTMPMWLVSGTFFAWERFPEVLHPFIAALPLTALNDALRAITNHGAGLVEVLPQVGVLGVWAAIAFAVGLRLFRWR
jgi:ABC transporter DrrB family efflux protein